MKKRPKKQKLELSRETLRRTLGGQMSKGEIAGAGGGPCVGGTSACSA